MVDRETSQDCHQQCSGRFNFELGDLLPANKCLLENVFCIRRTPQHTVRNCEQERPVLVKSLQPISFRPGERIAWYVLACGRKLSVGLQTYFVQPDLRLPSHMSFDSAFEPTFQDSVSFRKKTIVGAQSF